MLDGGPRGFGMQLSTLRVLNKDFLSCWKINALHYSLFYACSYCQCLGKNCCSFFLVLVGRYGKAVQ